MFVDIKIFSVVVNSFFSLSYLVNCDDWIWLAIPLMLVVMLTDFFFSRVICMNIFYHLFFNKPRLFFVY